MRQFMAALAALLVALPVAAQMQVTAFNGVSGYSASGALTNTSDTVGIQVSGTQWATVTWGAVGTVGTVTINPPQISFDGGTNYIAAPYSKRLSTVTANPSVVAGSGVLVTGNVWETPLPANTTNFRLVALAGGTTTNVTVSAGTPYVPEMPVTAVLYDVSTTAGAANNTPTLDVTGWRRVVISIVTTTAATGAASLNIVDDGGTAIPIGTSASIAVGTYVFGWGDTGTFGTANPFTMAGGLTGLPLDRRLNVLTAGATTSATRIRVVARR